jgi:hypothetical protein
MNKYNYWYNSITENAKLRTVDGYTESHHIIPLSLGGPDTSENLVKLTAREHFICHWLLTKIYSTGDEHWKMLNALRIMRAESPKHKRYKTSITARVYENLKEEYANIQSEKYRGENNPMYGKKMPRESVERTRQANLGRIQPIDEKERQLKAQIGRKRKPFNAEWLEKLAESNRGKRNGMYGKIHLEDSKEKMRQKATGRTQSAETIAKKAEAIRGSKRERLDCPHCGKNVAVNIYARYHGNNCKTILTLN